MPRTPESLASISGNGLPQPPWDETYAANDSRYHRRASAGSAAADRNAMPGSASDSGALAAEEGAGCRAGGLKRRAAPVAPYISCSYVRRSGRVLSPGRYTADRHHRRRDVRRRTCPARAALPCTPSPKLDISTTRVPAQSKPLLVGSSPSPAKIAPKSGGVVIAPICLMRSQSAAPHGQCNGQIAGHGTRPAHQLMRSLSLCNNLLHKDGGLGESGSVPADLTLEEVVERYRNEISEGTLRNWRSMRIGPSFIKLGKAVLYPAEELDRWDRSKSNCMPTHATSFV